MIGSLIVHFVLGITCNPDKATGNLCLWPTNLNSTLQVMVDDSGQLVRSLDGVPNLRDAYRAKERVRMFGELVWEARKVRPEGRWLRWLQGLLGLTQVPCLPYASTVHTHLKSVCCTHR